MVHPLMDTCPQKRSSCFKMKTIPSHAPLTSKGEPGGVITANVIEKVRRQNEHDECKQAWLLDTVKAVIEQFKVPLPLQYSEFTSKLQKLPARAEVVAEEALPLEYCRVTPEHREADKKKLLADLKQGVVIPCARCAPGGP